MDEIKNNATTQGVKSEGLQGKVVKQTYTECINAIRSLSYIAPDSETKRSLERLADNVSSRYEERLQWLEENK